MTARMARHHRFAVLGLVCAALALACLAVISLPLQQKQNEHIRS
jgi:hypothetical protein